VPAGDQGREDERDLVVLADHDPLDVREDPGSSVDGNGVTRRRGVRRSHGNQGY